MNFKDFLNSGSLIKAKVMQLQQLVYSAQVQLAAIEDVNVTAGGNPYDTYDEATIELDKKYNGIADWGCYQARSIIDVRAAFTIGNGIQVVAVDPMSGKRLDDPSKYKKEMDFINQFIEYNNLDEEFSQDLAKEAEIEGRMLLRLKKDKSISAEEGARGKIGLRFLSWCTNRYRVKASDDDYAEYEEVKYNKGGQEYTLKKGDFIYKKFAGRIDKVNDIMSKTATILRLLEDLDKALNDLRHVNHLFGSPTPHFNCDDATSALALQKKLKELNWKIGRYLVTSGATFSMVSPDASGVESLIKEVVSLAKIISGVTGIPVHFLGLPDLMSNRSVSTDMFEMIIASTNRERKTWIGTYEELFKAALAFANDKYGTSFRTDVVSCSIPQVTAEKLKELVDTWLPLYNSNVIDLDYILAKIPDADVERIKGAAEAAAKREMDMLKQSLENNKGNEGDPGAEDE